MLKFGLDWSWVDLNYSKYTISESEEPGSGSRRHHKRPLILNELAVFYSTTPLQVTTKVTAPTLTRCDIVRYACKSKRISFLLVA